jgi:hypothetical protein
VTRDSPTQRPHATDRLVVIGVGRGGVNAVSRMIKEGLEGIEFIAVDTDAQTLSLSEAEHQIRVGDRLTDGRGAGGDPRIGADAAKEGEEVIVLQAKSSRLGMYLMGQALFSRELVKRFNPASVRSVALCKRDDAILRPLLESHPDVEVVVQESAIGASDEPGEGKGR